MATTLAGEFVANTLAITIPSSIGFLILIELVTTIVAITYLWKTDKVPKIWKIIMTPLFILLPYVDAIYLAYHGVQNAEKGSLTKKIISKIK